MRYSLNSCSFLSLLFNSACVVVLYCLTLLLLCIFIKGYIHVLQFICSLRETKRNRDKTSTSYTAWVFSLCNMSMVCNGSLNKHYNKHTRRRVPQHYLSIARPVVDNCKSMTVQINQQTNLFIQATVCVCLFRCKGEWRWV